MDCNPLKHAILSHCFDWHNRIGKLLLDNTAYELLKLHDKMHNQSALVGLVSILKCCYLFFVVVVVVIHIIFDCISLTLVLLEREKNNS